MNTVEDLVRSELRAHAEGFSASEDAWQRIEDKTGARPARSGWTARFTARTVPVPAIAAAAVIAVIVAGTLAGRALTRHPAGHPPVPSGGQSTGHHQPGGPPGNMMFTFTPPVTPVLTDQFSEPGPVSVVLWFGYDNPGYWTRTLTSGLQFCHDAQWATQGSSGFCVPVPSLGPGRPVSVAGFEVAPGSPSKILVGTAAPQVASVRAVLPGGRVFTGQVRLARGFPARAWAVSVPGSTTGIHLVFADAAGHVVATTGTAAPIGPGQAARPATGGIVLFRYPGSSQIKAGAMTAYLVSGHVEFWSPIWGGLVSPSLPAGEPALSGLAAPFAFLPGDVARQFRAFGYAHDPVVRVVLRLQDGRQLSTATVAGWPGTDFRLWQVSLPPGVLGRYGLIEPITVTGYNAAGHAITTTQLGSQD